jgi:hypothetical protein
MMVMESYPGELRDLVYALVNIRDAAGWQIRQRINNALSKRVLNIASLRTLLQAVKPTRRSESGGPSSALETR